MSTNTAVLSINTKEYRGKNPRVQPLSPIFRTEVGRLSAIMATIVMPQGEG